MFSPFFTFFEGRNQNCLAPTSNTGNPSVYRGARVKLKMGRFEKGKNICEIMTMRSYMDRVLCEGEYKLIYFYFPFQETIPIFLMKILKQLF